MTGDRISFSLEETGPGTYRLVSNRYDVDSPSGQFTAASNLTWNEAVDAVELLLLAAMGHQGTLW